jgi:hypothetical protein
MPTLAKRSSLLAALILGFSALSSIPVRSETAPEFARGDLVQLRSGGAFDDGPGHERRFSQLPLDRL